MFACLKAKRHEDGVVQTFFTKKKWRAFIRGDYGLICHFTFPGALSLLAQLCGVSILIAVLYSREIREAMPTSLDNGIVVLRSLALKIAYAVGSVPPTLDHTLITLIPKVESLEKITQFRPINLCSVSLKLFIKILVDQLRPMLEGLVGRSQSSFIPKRQAINNVIVVQEAIHTDNSIL
ncbi:Uncharacterized protein TCM_026609 [Theobroma cacao]|uniref:Reverse transcriptase domain-containing protein n=1 Tax=Theobroma cacao TaxID=3641 RepID=A0A061F415_THECC|nr:Uncharacterized protein TCM_026609 [Theobroma cacao]